MSITRRTWTDDNGTGTTGTIIDNAELQAIFDVLDGRWSEVTLTNTGSANNLSFSEADHLRFNNASALTVTGLSAPTSPSKPGKPLIVTADHTSGAAVALAHESGSSSAANRIVTGNGVTIYLTGTVGRALLVYDAVLARWRVVAHDQGTSVGFTPTWAAGSGTPPSIGNGTLAALFYVQGRVCEFEITLTAGSTTTFGSGGYLTFTLPFTAGNSGRGDYRALYYDASTSGLYPGVCAPASTTAIIPYTNASPAALVTNTAPFTWAVGDRIEINGRFFLA